MPQSHYKIIETNYIIGKKSISYQFSYFQLKTEGTLLNYVHKNLVAKRSVKTEIILWRYQFSQKPTKLLSGFLPYDIVSRNPENDFVVFLGETMSS